MKACFAIAVTLVVNAAPLAAAPLSSGSPETTASTEGGRTGAPSDDPAKARARVHLERGVQAYRDARYRDAIDAFLEANRIYPTAALSYNTAKAFEGLGDRPGALRFYRDYLRRDSGAPDRAEVSKIVTEIESELRARGVQQVTILSEPDAATVVLDGRPVGVTPFTAEIFPGAHEVVLQREGYEEAPRHFELVPHRAMDVSFVLTEKKPVAAPVGLAPVQRAAPRKADQASAGGVGPLTLAVLGTGLAGLGGGLTFHFLAKDSEAAARSAGTQLEAASEIEAMQSRRTVGLVLGGVGAALTLAGGTLLVLDLGAGDDGRAVAMGCGGALCGLRVSGTFGGAQ